MLRLCVFVAVFEVLMVWTLMAQTASPEEGQESAKISNYDIARALDAQRVASFPLDLSFLTRMENIRKEIEKLPVEADVSDGDDDMTLKGLIQSVEARPHLVAILAKYDMSADDYVVGAMALGNALSAAAEEADPAFQEEQNISADNFAFGKKYLERIRALYAY